jgi:hypothetical protein
LLAKPGKPVEPGFAMTGSGECLPCSDSRTALDSRAVSEYQKDARMVSRQPGCFSDDLSMEIVSDLRYNNYLYFILHRTDQKSFASGSGVGFHDRPNN